MIESPFASARRKGEGSPVPPPSYVRYIPQGEIRDAWPCSSPYDSKSRSSAARSAGLRFQRSAERWATSGNWHGDVQLGPWYCFLDGSASRHFCQPDIVFRDDYLIVVCEVKVSLSPDAWWQIERLYKPVLRRLYPKHDLLSLCVCKSVDPAVAMPEPWEIRSDLFDCKPRSFNVMMLP